MRALNAVRSEKDLIVIAKTIDPAKEQFRKIIGTKLLLE